jgi:hypothetical protein
MPGFAHNQTTPFGTATFWQISKIAITLGSNPVAPNPSMLITVSGWTSQADAYSGQYEPLGAIDLPVGPTQIAAFFATANSNFVSFIESVWPDATYLTP